MTSEIYSDLDMEMTKQTDGDITKVTDVYAVVNSLTNIINTLQGSRRMLPEFGGDIQTLLFDPIDDVTAQLIGERIIEGIEYWEDRVEALGMDIEPNYDSGEYICRLDIRIKTTGSIESLDFILK